MEGLPAPSLVLGTDHPEAPPSMVLYVIRRLFNLIPTFIIATFLAWGIIQAAPGTGRRTPRRMAEAELTV